LTEQFPVQEKLIKSAMWVSILARWQNTCYLIQ